MLVAGHQVKVLTLSETPAHSGPIISKDTGAERQYFTVTLWQHPVGWSPT